MSDVSLESKETIIAAVKNMRCGICSVAHSPTQGFIQAAFRLQRARVRGLILRVGCPVAQVCGE